ncbi:MAG: efflux RND transporter periplasmic adaptor subunit, partial [Bacteroidota bacterium]
MLRRIQILCSLSSLLFVATILAGCGSEARSEEAEQPEEEAVVPVEAALAQVGEASAFYSGTAYIEAEAEATVVAKATGIVTGLFVEEGQYVE